MKFSICTVTILLISYLFFPLRHLSDQKPRPVAPLERPDKSREHELRYQEDSRNPGADHGYCSLHIPHGLVYPFRETHPIRGSHRNGKECLRPRQADERIIKRYLPGQLRQLLGTDQCQPNTGECRLDL